MATKNLIYFSPICVIVVNEVMQNKEFLQFKRNPADFLIITGGNKLRDYQVSLPGTSYHSAPLVMPSLNISFRVSGHLGIPLLMTGLLSA